MTRTANRPGGKRVVRMWQSGLTESWLQDGSVATAGRWYSRYFCATFGDVLSSHQGMYEGAQPGIGAWLPWGWHEKNIVAGGDFGFCGDGAGADGRDDQQRQQPG